MDRRFVVVMSEEEAIVLASILNRIGGDPNGPRKHMTEMSRKLRDWGIEPNDSLIKKDGFRNSVYLKDTWE